MASEKIVHLVHDDPETASEPKGRGHSLDADVRSDSQNARCQCPSKETVDCVVPLPQLLRLAFPDGEEESEDSEALGHLHHSAYVFLHVGFGGLLGPLGEV